MAREDVATDHGRSWVVAACCCFCNLAFYGVSRLSGIMLVSTTHTFNVTRARAALPFSLSTAIRNLAGVFVGHLGHKFGVAPVIAIGCLIASFGAGLCFFADDMLWLTLCWGGIFGIGCGLSTCLLPLAINQHFKKHTGTASGISYSGAYIGSFILPPIVVSLIENYGLQGTFLIISGSLLNVIVASMLLKEPKPVKKLQSGDAVVKDGGSSRIEYVGGLIEQNLSTYLDSQMKGNNYSFSNGNICLINYKFFLDGVNDVKTSSEIVGTEISKESNKRIENCRIGTKLFTNCKYTGIYKTTPESLTKDNNVCVQTSQIVKYPVSDITGKYKESSTFLKYFLKKPDFDCKLLSKGKSRTKCKLLVQKLKRILVHSLVNKSNCFDAESEPRENIKLTSFKYIQPLMYYSISDNNIPKNCFKDTSSVPNSKIMRTLDVNILNEVTNDETYHSGSPNEIKLNAIQHDNHSSFQSNNDSPSISNRDCDKIDAVIRIEKDDATSRLSSNNYETCVNIKQPSTFGDMDVNSIMSNVPESKFCFHRPYSVSNLSSELFLQHKVKSKATKQRVSRPGNSDLEAKRPLQYIQNWKRMLWEPVFIFISLTMSMHTLILVCVVTTIEDYAKDMGIPENKVHYALMVLSIANLIGTLTLGAITDRGLISRHRFLSLCFLGMSICLVAVSLAAKSLPSLLPLVALYGLMESGVIITFPILTKEFIRGERRQAVAIASSNVLSAPTVMLVPMLIGHFRENIGCYSGLFHMMGAISFACSLIWLVAPSICRRKNERKEKIKNLQ